MSLLSYLKNNDICLAIPEQANFTNAFEGYSKDAEISKLLKYISFCSPFLAKIITSDYDFFTYITQKGADKTFTELLVASVDDLAQLRILKRKVALVAGIADIIKAWDMETVTLKLSEFADFALNSALRLLLKEAALNNEIIPSNPDDILDKCGLSVISMGKLGAQELNYSSDIDLILLFDEEKIKYNGKKELIDFMVSLSKKLVAAIDERTKDGYVFRVDLRIRPDPSSTPIIMSADAAERYYESFGKNWERAALIKARPCAGDISLGEDFIKRISPFVWRKSLDFKAISDIKDIKNQLNLKNVKASLEDLHGYNIKLNHGGIREIEFFVQVNQLIWGGRNKNLRNPTTLGGLKELWQNKYITDEVYTNLTNAYKFLRNLEHRLQMENDEQTHSLPTLASEMNRIALFMGFADTKDFIFVTKKHLANTAKVFSDFFIDSMSEKNKANHLINAENFFDEIKKLGFKNLQTADKIIQGWKNGIYRSLRSRRSQEVIEAVLPNFLKQIGKTSSPDASLCAMDGLLRKTPSGIQLFPLFYAKPEIMNMVVEIIGNAPLFANDMQNNPVVLEELVNPDFYLPLADTTALTSTELSLANMTYENALNALQLWTSAQKFKASVHIFTNMMDGEKSGKFIAHTARTVIAQIIPLILKDFMTTYGEISASNLSVLLLGRNGNYEATPKSDLDLIFIYDNNDEEAYSNGEKALPIKVYYSRLVQRCITALTAEGKNGKIWDVDMRLRPSGNSGPLATSLQAFKSYQDKEAWAWELMALTKASVAYGNHKTIEPAINRILSKERDTNKLADDIIAMRQRMLSEHKAISVWDLKNLAGGMTDIEFMAQYIQLAYASKHRDILQKNTLMVFKKAKELNLLSEDTADFLYSTYQYMLSLRSLISLNGSYKDFTPLMKQRMATAANISSFDALENKLLNDSEKVHDLFINLPAEKKDFA